MPTYTCTTSTTLLTQPQRQSLARAITAAHHEITGAPAFFAQVLFHRLDPACHFIGGEPARDDALFIEGRIRDGRGPETIRTLIERLIEEAATIAGVPKSAVWVYIQDMPSEQMAASCREPARSRRGSNDCNGMARREGRRVRGRDADGCAAVMQTTRPALTSAARSPR